MTSPARLEAQQSFLRRNPKVTCFACGERPQPGSIYRYSERKGWAWCIHLARACKAKADTG